MQSDPLEDILYGLREPGLAGVFIVGGPGLGKSTLARAAVAKLSSTHEASWIRCHQNTLSMPYGALRAFTGDELGDGAQQLSIQGAMRSQLGLGRRLERIPLIIVEDAHLLDEGSCAVLEQLAVSGSLRILLLARPEEGPARQSGLFTDDTLLAQVTLEPLNGSEGLRLCEQWLGGHVVPGAAAALLELSGGNPMILQSLISSGTVNNNLVRHRHVWALGNDPGDVDLQVADMVRTVFLEYSPLEQLLLETVALGEPLDRRVLGRLGGEEELHRLCEARILKIDGTGGGTVRFLSPIFGRCVRERVPVGRSLRIRQGVLQARQSLPSSSLVLMRHVRWSLDCGQRVPDRLLVHAARIANKYGEYRDALRLAVAVSDTAFVIPARVEMARAQFERGNNVQAKAVLEGLVESATNPTDIDAASVLKIAVELRAGANPDALLAVAASWDHVYGGLGFDGGAGAELVRIFAQTRSVEGLPAAEANRLRSLAIVSRVAGVRLAAAAILAQWAGNRGARTEAQQAFAKARLIMTGAPERFSLFGDVIRGAHLLFLIGGGDFELVVQQIQEDNKAAGSNRNLDGVHALVEGWGFMVRGLVQTALEKFEIAVAALRGCDPIAALPTAVGYASYASYLLSDRDKATAFAVEFSTLNDAGGTGAWLLAKSLVLGARNDASCTPSTASQLADLAAQARRSGLAGIELAILEVLLRLGHTGQLARMTTVSAEVEGPVALALNHLVQGLLNADPLLLEKAALVAESVPYQLLAAEALAYALRIHIRGNDVRGRSRVLAALRSTGFHFEAIGSEAVAELLLATELTPREKEIVAFVQTGYSNKDIAESLTLSLRTVEGHLYKVFTKLGVNSRDELYATKHESAAPAQVGGGSGQV